MISGYVTPKGLDIQSSDIDRRPDNARDLLNCHLNDAGELVKRYGYSSHSTLANCLQLFEYKTKKILMALATDGLYQYKSSTWNKVPEQFDGGIVYSKACSYAEKDGLLFIADSEGVNPLMKFDGFSFFQSGSTHSFIQKHTETGYAVTVDHYVRPVIGILHDQDVVYGGMKTQGYKLTSAKSNWIFRVELDRYGELTGYDVFTKYEPNFIRGIWISGGGVGRHTNLNGPAVISSTDHNLSVGDVLYCYELTGSAVRGQPAIVTDITGSNVTFDTTNFRDGYRWDFTDQSGMVLLPFMSVNELDNFKIRSGTHIDFTYGTVTYTMLAQPLFKVGIYYDTNSSVFDPVFNNLFMNNVYSEVERFNAPRAKHVSIHMGALIMSSLAENEFREITNAVKNSILWSMESGVGVRLENFNTDFNQEIGIASEGFPTSTASTDDGLIVFKDKQFFYISGEMATNYRITRGRATGLGNASKTVTANINGNVVFVNRNGLFHYNQNALMPNEFGKRVKPLFSDLSYGYNLAEITSSINSLDEMLMFVLPHATDPRVLLYDYHFDQFFMYDIDATGGLVTTDAYDTYYSDGTNIYQKDTSYNDNGIAIDAFWKSGYNHGNAPSLESNFIRLIVYSILSTPWKCTVKNFIDWNNSERISTEIALDGIKKFFTVGFSKERANSMSIEISNNILDEPMHITGFQYEATEVQQRPKR